MENVLSCTSSGFSFSSERAREVVHVALDAENVFSSAFFTTGTSRPQSSATAMPI